MDSSRHGTARFAYDWEIQQAGFLNHAPNKVQLGFAGNNPFYVGNKNHLVTVAGAGAGKLSDVIAYNLSNYAAPMAMLDPKGELTEISLYHQHRLNVKQYCFNPYQERNLPHHDINILKFLRTDSLSLNSDITICARNFIISVNRGDNPAFAESGQRWFSALTKFDLEHNPSASLQRIYSYIRMIESYPERFLELANIMRRSRFEDVAATAQEIITKQEAPKEFTAIMGTLHNAFAFMNEVSVASSLERDECNIEDIVLRPGAPITKISIIIPAEYLEINAPLIRLFFTVLMIIKQREPQAPPVLYVIDEAGQLGKFEELLKLYSYGRGGGNIAWTFWQNLSQIERNLGREAISIILGSSQYRQFFGIRDIETARYISGMLGSTAFYFNNEVNQAHARNGQMRAIRSILEGHDPLFAAYEAQMYANNSVHQETIKRVLREPDELLRLPSYEQIIFVSEDDQCLYPVLLNKNPYYEKPFMAGKFLPNSSHPPTDKIQLQGRFGKKWARVLEADPPRDKRDWPQFKNGFKYIERYL